MSNQNYTTVTCDRVKELVLNWYVAKVFVSDYNSNQCHFNSKFLIRKQNRRVSGIESFPYYYY